MTPRLWRQQWQPLQEHQHQHQQQQQQQQLQPQWQQCQCCQVFRSKFQLHPAFRWWKHAENFSTRRHMTYVGTFLGQTPIQSGRNPVSSMCVALPTTGLPLCRSTTMRWSTLCTSRRSCVVVGHKPQPLASAQCRLMHNACDSYSVQLQLTCVKSCT